MVQRSVMVRLDALVAPYVAGMGKAAAATAGFARSTQAQLGTATAQTTKLGQATGALPGKFGALASVGGAAFAGLGLAIGGSVKAFADFDVAMDAVAASTGASGAELEQLGDTAIKAAADTKFGAVEAARGIEALGKAGISTADIIGGGLKGALDLAAAGEIEVAEAAELAAGAMTQFGLSGRDVPHIADLMAAAAGKAQGDVSDMAMALKQSGLVASQMGLSIEETTGTLAAFASNALIGSDAGTSFRTMLLRLANPSGEARDLMEQLGIRAYDATGAFVGMASLAGQLQQRLGGLTQAQRDQALATIFGSDAIRAANVLYQQGLQGVRDWEEKVDDAGFASDQAAQRTDNLRGDLERLGGTIESIGINIGEQLDGPLRGFIQWVDNALEKYNEWEQEQAGDVSWENLIRGIERTDQAIDNWLPGWLQMDDKIGETRIRREEHAEAIERENSMLQQEQAAIERHTSGQETAAEAVAVHTAEIEELTAAAFEMSEQFLKGRDATRDWEAAVDDAAAALDENGETLDVTTEKGRANEEALDAMAQAGLNLLQQMTETGENTEAAHKQMRDALIATGIRFGMEEQDAKDYADQVFAASQLRINTPVTVSDAAARAKVKAWRDLINAQTAGEITVSIRAIERAAGQGGRGFMGFPLPGGPGAYRITQGPHDGGAIDYAAAIGTPVFATFGGYLDVTDLGNRSYGKYYTNRSTGRYELGAHLSAFARGDGAVAPGNLVGWTGNTGKSTGPHLHYLRNFHTGGWTGGGPINTLSGEFVVNPAASSANATLLEAINAGRGSIGFSARELAREMVREQRAAGLVLVSTNVARQSDLLVRAG